MWTGYGFQWGPVNVVRRSILKRGDRTTYALGIETDHHDLEVHVSRTGRSVRVWLDGKELSA